MRAPLRLWTAILGAALVHGALLAATALLLPHSTFEGGAAPRPCEVIDLETEVAPDTTGPVDHAAPSSEHRAPTPGTPAAGHAERSEADDTLAMVAPAPGASRSADAPPTSEGAPRASAEPWSFSALTGHAELGLTPGGPTGAARDAVVGTLHDSTAGEGTAPAPGDRTDTPVASLHRALDARDREVGLGAGGPLVQPTRDAVRQSLAPTVGFAVLEFRTDGSGFVASVRVLEASSDRKAWDDVAGKLATSARAHPLRVPPGSKGVAVSLRVESRVELASGHDAGETSVSLFGVPLKRSKAAHPVHVDVGAILGGLGLSGNLDPTDALLDATSHSRRVVTAWVVDERRL